MPIYQFDVQKHIGTEYWTNVYHAQADDDADALLISDEILNAELGIHYSNVDFDKTLVRPYPPVAGDFVERPHSIPGLRSGSADLALFNVARLVFPATVGKAGIKMYRGALNEGDQEGIGAITEATRVFFETWGLAFKAAVPTLCKADGTLLGAPTINLAVGMRQLRRGSKRPVI